MAEVVIKRLVIVEGLMAAVGESIIVVVLILVVVVVVVVGIVVVGIVLVVRIVVMRLVKVGTNVMRTIVMVLWLVIGALSLLPCN